MWVIMEARLGFQNRSASFLKQVQKKKWRCTDMRGNCSSCIINNSKYVASSATVSSHCSDPRLIHFKWAVGDVVRQSTEWQLVEGFWRFGEGKGSRAEFNFKWAGTRRSHRHLVVCRDYRKLTLFWCSGILDHFNWIPLNAVCFKWEYTATI